MDIYPQYRAPLGSAVGSAIGGAVGAMAEMSIDSIAPQGSVKRIRLDLANEKLVLDPRYRDADVLVYHVLRRAIEVWRDDAVAALERGMPVVSGNITLTLQGVQRRGETIPWAEVRDAEMRMVRAITDFILYYSPQVSGRRKTLREQMGYRGYALALVVRRQASAARRGV